MQEDHNQACVLKATFDSLLLKHLREASLSPSPASSHRGRHHHLSLCLFGRDAQAESNRVIAAQPEP